MAVAQLEPLGERPYRVDLRDRPSADSRDPPSPDGERRHADSRSRVRVCRRVLCEERLDRRHQGMTIVTRRRPEHRDDRQRERLEPPRPVTEPAGRALGDRLGVPRTLEKRVGEPSSERCACVLVVHTVHDRGAGLRLLLVVRARTCFPGRTPRARDALAQVMADPRGIPGEEGASAEAPAELGARRRGGARYRMLRVRSPAPT